MTRAELESELVVRQSFVNTLTKTNEGTIVIAEVLNRCGYFADDPQAVKPELVAFANWFLGKCGIYARFDLAPEHLFAQVEALTRGATDRELVQALEAINKEATS